MFENACRRVETTSRCWMLVRAEMVGNTLQVKDENNASASGLHLHFPSWPVGVIIW